jgi:chromosome segregation ATPase
MGDDLERRYKLLVGERKLNIEKYTTELKNNTEMIKKLNEDNNRIRAQIANNGNRISGGPSGQNSSRELIKINSKINILKEENMRKEKILSELHAKVALTDRSIVNEDNNSQSRQIRVLENRIDKAMIKLNEAQSIKKTYESILDRLKEERVGFDKSLAELETQLKAKKKDHDDLLLLLHDAVHAKELSHAELHRFEQAVMEERNQRDREVMEKRLLVQKRVEMNQALEQSKKAAVISDPPADPVLPLVETTVPDPTHTDSFNRQRHRDLAHYEEAFNRLKDATGVSDVNEIIQKFVNQETTHKDLTNRISEQQERLNSLQAEYGDLTHQLEELKFSGNGLASSSNRKQALEDIEKHTIESLSKLERNKLKYEKLARVMIDVNAGVSHLMAKLADIRAEDTGNRYSSASLDIAELNDDTIEEVLSQCELKIGKLVSVCTHSQDNSNPNSSPQKHDPEVRVRILKDEGKLFHIDDIIDEDNSLFFALRQHQYPTSLETPNKFRRGKGLKKFATSH